MQIAPLLFVLQFHNLPVDLRELLEEAPELVITPPHFQCLQDKSFSDIERNCFSLHLGGQAEPGHGRGLGHRADEEGVKVSGDFLAEPKLSSFEKGES